MRRACALGRNPRRWIASSTRVRVFRLTCELEFSTREIVPMPTPAARATSRMVVVFAGTASIAIGVLVAFAPGLRFAGQRPDPFPCASLAHHKHDNSKQCGWLASMRFGQEVKKVVRRSQFQESRLDRRFLLG